MTTAAKPKFKTVEEYLAPFSQPVKEILEELRTTIKKAAPQAEEVISYNMPAYKLNGFLVSFAGWKKHIGLYPIPKGDANFQKEIAAYKAEKSTLQLPLDKPLPLDLITRLVKFRMLENLEKVK